MPLEQAQDLAPDVLVGVAVVAHVEVRELWPPRGRAPWPGRAGRGSGRRACPRPRAGVKKAVSSSIASRERSCRRSACARPRTPAGSSGRRPGAPAAACSAAAQSPAPSRTSRSARRGCGLWGDALAARSANSAAASKRRASVSTTAAESSTDSSRGERAPRSGRRAPRRRGRRPLRPAAGLQPCREAVGGRLVGLQGGVAARRRAERDGRRRRQGRGVRQLRVGEGGAASARFGGRAVGRLGGTRPGRAGRGLAQVDRGRRDQDDEAQARQHEAAPGSRRRGIGREAVGARPGGPRLGHEHAAGRALGRRDGRGTAARAIHRWRRDPRGPARLY